jgi:hypothetical protein
MVGLLLVFFVVSLGTACHALLVVASGEKNFQVAANNEIYEYGMVLFQGCKSIN